MTKRMLIDATHAEETRVVVLDGNRLEDFDVESSTKKQLKGNIYLAKIVRVEPSLQAAFVEYGGGRHGFLAFGEIHPDYYQIPVADRQRLLAMQAEEARAEEEAEDEAAEAPQRAQPRGRGPAPAPQPAEPAAAATEPAVYGEVEYGAVEYGAETTAAEAAPQPDAPDEAPAIEGEIVESGTAFEEQPQDPDAEPPEMLGGESDTFEGNGAEEARQRRTARFLRNYRIQEVIRRRQIMLIQVVKEERGTKGAALTTYISLAGRFCVLMPNSPRGGGISRKITSAADRRRLKEITAELQIPQGMGLIVRTAGAARPKPEITRDCEYLMRLWDDIREHTMRSVAPALIYEEASLIKRTIRDVYSRDVDEVVVDGYEGWKAAHDFMRMLMPSHAKKVQLWRTDGPGAQPLFVKHQVEAQLDSMLSPTVQLKSGGYLVINQAEALVAIDVNSGRSTRERGIEETALRTNLEAADEVARQLRLRDLAGLIVIDFIDMDAKKHNAMVERRLKEGLKNDRARIQVGYISHFGLLEMSRQRLRPSLTETNFVTCPHCNGLGHVRSIESSAVHVLRGIEEEGAKDRASVIMVHAANAIVMYILNNKRERLAEIETRYAMRVQFAADESLVPPGIRIDRVRPQIPVEERAVAAPVAPVAPLLGVSDEDIADEEFEDEPEDTAEAGDEGRRERGPRGRRDRGRRERTPAVAPEAEAAVDPASTVELEAADAVAEPAVPGSAEAGAAAEETRRRRRRRRRGGRRDGADAQGGESAEGDASDGESGDDGQDGEPQQSEAFADGADAVPALAESGSDMVAAEPTVTDAPVAEPAAVEAAGGEIPEGETELDENGEPRARRRGRRGGRRRRRDTPEGGAPEDAELPIPSPGPSPGPATVAATPAAEPPYAGPTPADPFGGQTFDIFDMIDQAAEEDRAIQQARKAKAAAVPPPEPVAPEPVAPEPAGPAEPDAPVELAATGRLDSPVTPVPPQPALDLAAAPEPAPESVPEPAPEPAPAVAEAPAPTPVEPEPTGPVAGPAVRPVVIGVDDIAATPKKGWWKR